MISQYEFGQLIIKLEEALNFYKKTNYRFNELKLYLSNGQILEFMFKPQNIPHLLGIDIINLKTSKVLTATKPLEMMEELIERYSAIYQKCVRGELKYDDIFSPYIYDKIEAFETILKCDVNDIYFVSEYSLPRSYVTGEKDNLGCQYYIAFSNDKNELVFLGLKRKDNEFFYSPSSILNANEIETREILLKKIVENQRIMLVNCVGIKNIRVNNYLKNLDKLILAQNLINLANKYDGHFILGPDFVYNLKKLISAYDKDSNVKQFISNFMLAISKGKKAKANESLDEEFSELCDAYNMLLQRTNKSDIQGDLLELKRLKEELLQAQKTIEEQQKQLATKDGVIDSQQTLIEEQQSKITQLEEETSSLRNFQTEAFQLFKKYQ